MKKLFILAMMALLFISTGCDKRELKVLDNREQKVLIVKISKNPSGLAADNTYIKNAIQKGGMIELNAAKVQSIDPDWYYKYDVVDDKGNYLVYPMLLNWVASQGWKLQTVFCFNLNPENEEFFFVK